MSTTPESRLVSPQTLVVIPTYNEVDNVDEVARLTLAVSPTFDILFVDDNSTDGTQQLIGALINEFPGRIHLLARPGKLGLGTAYIAGFKWGLAKSYGYLMEMDADLSHNPHDLKRIASLLLDFPVVVGSRYVKGGGTENWSLLRQIISRCGSLYSRLVLGFHVRDMTAGFVGWRRQVLETIKLDHVKSQGYGFQVELKFRAHRAGFTIHETPIIFRDRIRGTSKMGAHIIVEAMRRVFLLRLASLKNPEF